MCVCLSVCLCVCLCVCVKKLNNLGIYIAYDKIKDKAEPQNFSPFTTMQTVKWNISVEHDEVVI